MSNPETGDRTSCLNTQTDVSHPPPSIITAANLINPRTFPPRPFRGRTTPSAETVPSIVPPSGAGGGGGGSLPCGFSSDTAGGTRGGMHQTTVTSAVWQRRTNKIIAAGLTVIGLTMMLSLIPQCIYIGVVFVASALIWLGWMTMKEKKEPPPRPEEHQTSPVLFLVASHHLRQGQRVPTLADPNDKPPSYDQILTLDGLPPDYFSIVFEKPPRYEDLSASLGWGACALPVELFSSDIPCVHSGQHQASSSASSPLRRSPSSEFPTRPAEPESSASATFFGDLPPSWSSQSLIPTNYNDAQPVSVFSREHSSFENPSFEPALTGSSSDIDERLGFPVAIAPATSPAPSNKSCNISIASHCSMSSPPSFYLESERPDISQVTENTSLA